MQNEPLEQIVNIPTTVGPMWDLVEIGQVVSEKKFKDFGVGWGVAVD